MKKKGFTLIELLAVIVILAIIALIATPLVLKYIETSRVESFKVSVENIKDSALKYAASEQLKGKVTYPVIVDVQDLDFKGKEDYTGKVLISQTGMVEEYIEKGNYRSGNGGFVDKKSEPYLIFKNGYSGTIDEKNKYVYSFYTNKNNSLDYKIDAFNPDIFDAIFDTTSGIISYEKSSIRGGGYSTGAKIIISDENNNILKEYQIIIFGDLNGQGFIDNNSISSITNYINHGQELNDIKLKAADLNRDGVVDNMDLNILLKAVKYGNPYNQINNKLEEV